MSTDLPSAIQQGNNVEIDTLFTQKKGTVLIDPDNVYAKYTVPGTPGPTLIAYTPPTPGSTALQRNSQGSYTVVIAGDAVGTYKGKIYSTGKGKASRDFEFTVVASVQP